MSREDRDRRLLAFADKHQITLERRGSCGFGRPCVGFTKGIAYVDYHPLDMDTYEEVPGFRSDEDDNRLYAPSGVNAYRKHNILAVLADFSGNETDEDYEMALDQLMLWVIDLVKQPGVLEVVQYRKGGNPLQQMLSGGSMGYAIRFKP